MTRAEAIEALTNKDVCNPEIMLEALDIAINSLKVDEMYQIEYERADLFIPLSVIKDIKAEIEHIGGDDEKAFCKNLNESYKQGLKDVLVIIDKHIRGRE